MTKAMHRGSATGFALLLFAWASHADEDTTVWPQAFVQRLEALALLQTLNAELSSHDSATATLEHWCEVHHLASPAQIAADRLPDLDKPPTAMQRRELQVTANQPVRYRHVKLRCGSVVLSEAENWYVPVRLTAGMNRQLDTTDAPFGLVVRALQFKRHTLAATLLWHPLPDGWELHPAAAAVDAEPLRVPAQVLQHRAVLVRADGKPISEVVETYTSGVMAFVAAPADAGELPSHAVDPGDQRIEGAEKRQ